MPLACLCHRWRMHGWWDSRGKIWHQWQRSAVNFLEPPHQKFIMVNIHGPFQIRVLQMFTKTFITIKLNIDAELYTAHVICKASAPGTYYLRNDVEISSTSCIRHKLHKIHVRDKTRTTVWMEGWAHMKKGTGHCTTTKLCQHWIKNIYIWAGYNPICHNYHTCKETKWQNL